MSAVSTQLCDLAGGDLSTSPLASILIEALRIRCSGELLIEAKGGISRVYFRRGQPCGAEIFFGFKPLGQFLLERGIIDIRALERSLVAVADGRKQGEALVALGLLTEEQLVRALAEHHLSHVRTLAQLTEGTYRFTPKEQLPSWTHEIRIPAHRAVVDALALPTGASVVRRLLRGARRHETAFVLRPGWERYAGYFHLDEAEALFLGKLVEPRDLSSILALPGLEPAHASALVGALYLMGMLAPLTQGEPAPLAQTPLPRATPGPATPGPTTPEATPAAAREPTPSDEPTPGVTVSASGEGPQERRLRLMRRAFENIGAGPFRGAGPRRATLPPEDPEGFRAWVQDTLAALPTSSPYELLGLSGDFDAEQVRQAYVRAARRLHPDRIPKELEDLQGDVRKIFVAIGEAYETMRAGRAAGHAAATAPSREWEELRARGLAALAEGRWHEARQSLTRALHLHATPDLQAHALWAGLHDPSNQNPAEQRGELERLYEAFPEVDAVCYYTGALARVEGDIERAERRFRAAIERNPHHREARQELRLLEIQRTTRGPLRG